MVLEFTHKRRQLGEYKYTSHKPEQIERLNERTEKRQEKQKVQSVTPMKNLEDSIKPKDVVELLKLALQDKNNGERDYVLMLTLLLSGRRISEVLELKQKHIDVENGTILWHILKKKDKNYHKWKPMPKLLSDNLAYFVKAKNLAPEDYVFFSYKKGRTFHIRREHAFTIIKKYGKMIGLKIHPHSFRHTYAIMMVRSMTNPSGLIILKNSLEHSNISITEKYLQFNPKETADLQEEMVEKLI